MTVTVAVAVAVAVTLLMAMLCASQKVFAVIHSASRHWCAIATRDKGTDCSGWCRSAGGTSPLCHIDLFIVKKRGELFTYPRKAW